MMSATELMMFSDSDQIFFENNLLDSDDWDKAAVFDYEYGKFSPTSSLSSDEVGYTENNSSPLQEDHIDSWLQNELQLLLPNINAEQDKEQTNSTCIKEEPVSPVSLTAPAITPFTLSPTSNIISTVPQHNLNLKIPISKYDCKKVLQNSNIQTVKSSSNILATNGTSTISSYMSVTNLSQSIPKSSHCANKRLSNTQNSQGCANPKVVKLENGQYCVVNTVMKSATLPVNKNQGNTKPDVIRASHVKTEELLPPPKTLNELMNYKRQQRMIKNRESACLSRQRKRERMSNLEERVNEINELNQLLKEENQQLKERIKRLETENHDLKENPAFKSNVKDAAKKSTVLLAVLLLFIFNPYSLLTIKENKQPIHSSISISEIQHRSRSLLQYDNSNIGNEYITYDGSVFAPKRPHRHSLNFLNDPFDTKKTHNTAKKPKIKNYDLNNQENLQDMDMDCGEQFNKTELSRINQALERLVKGFSKKKNFPKKKKKFDLIPKDIATANITNEKSKTPTCNGSNSAPKQLLPSQLKNLRHSKLKKILFQKQEALAQNTSQGLLEMIQKSIERKADTFYVVSFMKDFLILPATNYNNTQRPKVSFMLPAYQPHFNDSSVTDISDLRMLKIDCNVIDTKLIRVDGIPSSNNLLT